MVNKGVVVYYAIALKYNSLRNSGKNLTVRKVADEAGQTRRESTILMGLK
jgi:hypothetical protein